MLRTASEEAPPFKVARRTVAARAAWVVRWAKANPEQAEKILVKVGDEAITLKEAVKKL